MLGRVDVPQFLDTNAVMLGVFAFIQFELTDQALTQVPTTTFREQRVLCSQLHARHIAFFFGAVASDTHVSGKNAFYLTIFNDGLGCGKTRINFNAQRLSLLGKPAAKVTEADNIVAVVVHVLGHKGIRNLCGFLLVFQQENVVAGNGRIQRCAFLFPVRKELIEGGRLKYSTGQYVSADFRPFLYNTYGQFFAGFLCQLHNSASCRQASRAAADDKNIKFHRFAFHVGLLKHL